MERGKTGKCVSAEQSTWRNDDRELIRLVSLGLANKEIAARAGVSETAIKKRLCVLMNRVGASNRAALVRYAFRSGVIADDDEG